LTGREATAYVEGLQVFGMHLGLERIQALLESLDNPQRGIPAIHVVGSNGKSSTTRLAAAALESQGLSIGAYLSPHISGWRERILLQGEDVSAARFARSIGVVREASDGLRLPGGDRVTQFEVLTAAAFLTFQRARCDAMVIEAGLGGRYDASNVLAPHAVVALTNISLEHTDILGPTEVDVAGEKLAVAADGSDLLVVGRLSPAAQRAVDDECRSRHLVAWRLGKEVAVIARHGHLEVSTPGKTYTGLSLGVQGRFQRDNLAVGLAAAERLLGRPLVLRALRRGLSAVRIPGRLESFPGTPLVVLDGAHNPAGMQAMATSLPDAVGRRRPVAVVSVLDDKDLDAMVAALAPLARALVATRSSHSRAVDPALLAEAAAAAGLSAQVVDDPVHAIEAAQAQAGPRGAVLVTGSLYLLSDIRLILGNRRSTHKSEGNG
jgi:dihydrofolate synthase / folylpolyglutamate synthase